MQTVQTQAVTSAKHPRKRLGCADDVGAMCGFSARHAYRMADQGLMPWGVKIGALRRWDLDEIDVWIQGGCKAVRTVRGLQQ